MFCIFIYYFGGFFWKGVVQFMIFFLFCYRPFTCFINQIFLYFKLNRINTSIIMKGEWKSINITFHSTPITQLQSNDVLGFYLLNYVQWLRFRYTQKKKKITDFIENGLVFECFPINKIKWNENHLPNHYKLLLNFANIFLFLYPSLLIVSIILH